MVNKTDVFKSSSHYGHPNSTKAESLALRSKQGTGAGFYHPASSLDLLTFSSIA